MHVRDALEQIDQIHDQLTRAEVYRGIRVPAVVLVGILGLLAAILQERILSFTTFTVYWSAIAAGCCLLGTSAAVRDYWRNVDDDARRRSRRVMVQFVPCLLAGAAVTAVLASRDVSLLPGAWALIFGLGVVSASPFLPPATAWVGWGYALAGIALFLLAVPGVVPPGWQVGGVFALGHFATALALAGQRHD